MKRSPKGGRMSVNAIHVEDAATITQLYVDTLVAAGIERPAILP